ncbi:uncharacterized protein V6R79_005585 [Siganus canaliculatus]
MPINNNQKGQNAATRLVKLPVVGSACIKLSILYKDTKFRHPNLRSVCEGLESTVAALVSPAIVKLEPQIAVANDIACRSLDWLEAKFPVLHTPTEQIVATAKTKMHEIQDVMSVAAKGTVDCAQHTVTWLSDQMLQADQQADRPLVKRAISVAATGLDSALNVSEALVDRVLPPTEEDREEAAAAAAAAAHLVEGSEVATPKRSYPDRLVSLAAKLYKRTHYMVTENWPRSLVLVWDFQISWETMVQGIQGLPQYVQNQLLSGLFFVSQMYNLNCPPVQNRQPVQENGGTNTAEAENHTDMVRVHSRAAPPVHRLRRPIRTPVFENGCNVEGCGYR